MEVIILPSPDEASRLGARIIANLIKTNAGATLGLATGRTPLRLYRELILLHEKEGLDFSRVTTFNLDEYVGFNQDHPASYHFFMVKHLFSHINISSERTHLPDGTAEDIPASCLRYEELILEAGGIDLQVLGVGTDGHIGFNEPASSLGSRTRIKTLTRQTLQDNEADFKDLNQAPRHAITMGIGTILDSRKCLLLAFGENKAEAVARTVEGPVTSLVPGSALQFHPDTVFLLDEAAASNLAYADYYREVYQGKPDWQRP